MAPAATAEKLKLLLCCGRGDGTLKPLEKAEGCSFAALSTPKNVGSGEQAHATVHETRAQAIGLRNHGLVRRRWWRRSAATAGSSSVPRGCWRANAGLRDATPKQTQSTGRHGSSETTWENTNKSRHSEASGIAAANGYHESPACRAR